MAADFLYALKPFTSIPSKPTKRSKRKLPAGVINYNSNTKFKPNISQYELKLAKLRYAWINTYSTERPFPAEYIHFAYRSKAKLPPAQQELLVKPVEPKKHKDTTQYKTYSSKNDITISSKELHKLCANTAFIVQLVKAVKYKQCKSV